MSIKNSRGSMEMYILLALGIFAFLLAGGMERGALRGKPIPTPIPSSPFTLVQPSPYSEHTSLQLSTLEFYQPTTSINSCKGYTVIGVHECDVLYAYSIDNTNIKVFYADEWPMPLGVARKNLPVSQMQKGAKTDHVTSPKVGDIKQRDPNKYPYFPAVFLTDVTPPNQNSTSGYAQNGGTPISPDEVYGVWTPKGTTRGSIGSGNGTDLGPNADPWPSSSNGPVCRGRHEVFQTAEVVWHIANLKLNGQPLQSGHTYLAQFTVHDGDQTNDVADACVSITIP